MNATSLKHFKVSRARHPDGWFLRERLLLAPSAFLRKAEKRTQEIRAAKSRVRLAWVTCVIPSYRINFLGRLMKQASFDLDLYHGQGKEGKTVTSAGDQLEGTSIPVRNLYWPTRRPRIMWQRGVWRVVRDGYDVVVINENVHNMSNWLLFLGKYIFDYRIVLVGYGYRPQLGSGLHARLRDRLRGMVLRRADSIVTYTDMGREAVCAMGISPDRVFVYGNTLDVDELLETKRRLNQTRVRAPAPSPRLRVAYLGRLVPVKRVDLLIDALSTLKDPDQVSCDIIGDGIERASLEEKTASLPQVHFHGALYDPEEIAQVLMKADVLVLPGRVGLTVIHAFCLGIPVLTIGSGVEQSPEFAYLEHGRDSVVLGRPNAHELGEAIERLANDRALLWRLKLRSRRKAQRFRMDRMVSEFTRAVDAAMT